jgi:hypothetical protein
LASIFRRLSGLIRGRYCGLASAFAIGLRFAGSFFMASPSFRFAGLSRRLSAGRFQAGR